MFGHHYEPGMNRDAVGSGKIEFVLDDRLASLTCIDFDLPLLIMISNCLGFWQRLCPRPRPYFSRFVAVRPQAC